MRAVVRSISKFFFQKVNFLRSEGVNLFELHFKLTTILTTPNHEYFVFRDIPVLQYAIKLVSALIVILTILCFKYFSPFIYGVEALSKSEIEQKQWLSSWRFMIHR